MALIDKLTAIADAIRTKTEKTDLLTLDEMPSEIASIEGGGDKFVSIIERTITTITADDLAGVTSIGYSAFSDCESLTSVTIPDSVTSIDDYAFNSCTSLTSVTLPDSVTNIDWCAFRYCESLTSITIPDSVTSINNFAFEYCKSLTSINIPDKVTDIGSYAFSDCKSLTSVTIGSGMVEIHGAAFKDTGLTSFTCLAETPPDLGSDALPAAGTFTIYVPASSVDVYKRTPVWANYADYIQAITE